jgi:microcystin-dependent protein
MDPFLGEIRPVPYNFAPDGWLFCHGQILPIAQNTALFSLLGTTYGGNGQTTFALPDLRGRVPVGEGQGPGLSAYSLGEESGVESVALNVGELPPHTHTAGVSGAPATALSPQGTVAANAARTVYAAPGADELAADSITNTGSDSPHNNLQPYLGINYIIAMEGVFPPRN